MKRYVLMSIGLLLLGACSPKPGELVQPRIDQTIAQGDVSLSLVKDSLPADNYTLAEIKLTLATNDFTAGTQIAFKTDDGSFANGSKSYVITAASSGTFSAYLKSDTATASNVSVVINNNFSGTTQVHFRPAPPDNTTLEPDMAIVQDKSTSKVNLTAILSRTIGTPSKGQGLTFYDSTAIGGKSVGLFTNATLSNSANVVTAEYLLQDTTYKGYIYLKGYALNGKIKVIGITRILVQ
jgi:hypothetical protein